MSDDNSSDSSAGSAPDSTPETVEAIPSATTNAQVSGTSDSVPESAEAAPPVTVVAKESKVPDSSHSKAKETPSSSAKASAKAEKNTELRCAPRIRVRWHTDAFVDGQSVFHGFIKDVSLSGTDIFLERNLQKVKFVTLLIHVPPLSKSSHPHVMEVSAKVIYTAYDSNESLFHAGVNFTQFNLKSDLEYLKSRIAAINHDT